MRTITEAEWEILEAAKAIPFKPMRRIVDDREDSEDRGQSIPAFTGMLSLGSRGQLRRLGEAVIRWRKTQERDEHGSKKEEDVEPQE